MKKLFLLISVLFLAVMANAKVINITPTSPESSNNLRQALAAATTGDIIEMAAGTYVETGAWIAIEDKEVTVRAAEGAEVIIKPQYSVRVKAPNAAAKAEFIGVKFDCSALTSSELFVPSDDKPNQKVVLDNCELYNWPNNNALIHSTSARRLDVISINNCYFHGFEKSIVFVENANLVSLSITNSTFADVSASVTNSYWATPIDVRATSGEVLIDHCTFYNVKTMSSSYGVIQVNNISDVTISNSIFAHPSAVSQYAVSCVEGSTIDYCLAYNMNGYNGAASTHDRTGNPYFMNTDPANYDLTVWTTSPAHGTANDGYDLGDYQRWNTDPATHVATVNITADDANSLKTAVDAALPGDVIVLAAGTYEESESIALDKEITIKAADGASPIVKPVGNFAISNGVGITIQNIKFDGSAQSGVSNFIYAADALSNSLAVEGCEFYNFGNAVISASSSKLIGTCTVANCYFYNNTHSCIGLKNSAAANLTVSNSTFKNNDASGVGDGNGIGIVESKTATGTVLVDHCTFYNCKVLSTDFGITKVASPNATVSNCIFAMPVSTADLRTVYIPDGLTAGTTVTNCIMHNFTKDSNKGVPSRSGTTIANCNAVDPLFTDAANGDFTFPGDYVNDNVSPARNAGTDGLDLGDKRWYTAATYPETDFATGYAFTAAKAKLSGKIVYETGAPAQDPYIRYNHSTPTGTAEWIIKATRACYVQATVNTVDNTWNYLADDDVRKWFVNHKHVYVVEILDSHNNSIGSVKECDYEEDGSTDGVETDPNVTPDLLLPGYIYIPEAGVYTVKLKNPRNGARCGVGGVTISYMGGDVQTITNTADFVTNINDAYFSSKGTRADGKISFSGNAVASEWVRWNVTVANSDYYDITLNSDVASGHVYSVTFYDGETQVAQVAESGWHNTVGALPLGRRFLPAGDYVLEIKNSVESNSGAKIVSVEAVAFVAPTTALPATLKANDAILSELAEAASAEADETAVYFAPSDKYGHIQDQWAEWKVSVAAAGTFLFTMNVSSTNVQTYKITILDSENNELDYYEANPGSGDKTIKHYFNLAAGNYFVKVQNTKQWSNGHMVSLIVTQPELITLDEAATSNSSWADKKDDEHTYDVQIIRTIKAGMYNTFCLPFEVNSTQTKELFGADVEVYTLKEAVVDASNILTLTLKSETDIYQGTPVFIKVSHDVENPIFVDVEFKKTTAGTSTGDNANLVGTFVKTEIEPDVNNLFLAADNNLYWPENNPMPIKGMRAWFVIHDTPVPAPAIRRARFIDPNNMPTDITVVNSQDSNANNQKLIENGQLYIIRDGVRYNVMGIRIK